MVTAPLGAWAIPTFAPKLLERGEVDPTKVNITRTLKILAVVDSSPAIRVLTKAGDVARCSDASVIVLYVIQEDNPQKLEILKSTSQRLLADIRHQFVTVTGSIPEEIIRIAQDKQVTDIVMGKKGSVSQAVLESSSIPVILVD